MEFNFSINALFKEKLVKVKNNLLPEGHLADRRGDGDVVSKISTVLDKMGVVSAMAQNLPVAITSANKLRNSDHIVYILTDPDGNKGHGAVIGILKVGCKKLFIYDLISVQWEMEPMCVLDFYVYESKQRTGCGKLLFDHMLQDQKVSPKHLALDQPSESFLSFMCKHYGLENIIPQRNSFVVYDCFFDGRSDKGRGSSGHGANSKKNKNSIQTVKAISHSGDATPLPSFGRHSAKKAGSVMAEYMQDPSLMPQNGTSNFELDTSAYNDPSVPLVQYGHYWSSVGGLLNDNQISETDGLPYLNGDSSKNRARKVSNIPLGEGNRDADAELAHMVSPLALSTNQNGHPFSVGTNGVRDVRIKKTLFTNLSPYRK